MTENNVTDIRDRFFEDDQEVAAIREDEIDEAIARAEPALIRAQAKRAIARLTFQLEEKLEAGDFHQARALIEKIHLVGGDRRTKFVEVQVDRRRG